MVVSFYFILKKMYNYLEVVRCCIWKIHILHLGEYNMSDIYELVEYETNFPAKIMLQETLDLESLVPLHWHHGLEFDLVTEGVAQYKTERGAKLVTEGHFIYADSGEMHEIDSFERNRLLKMVTVLISYDFVKEKFPEVDEWYFEIAEDTQGERAIAKYLYEIGNLFREKKEFYEIKINALLLEICYILFTEFRKKKENTENENKHVQNKYVKMAIDFMVNYYNEVITLDKVSQMAGLSTYYFCKLFKKETNMTFYNFLNRIRLYYSLRELMNSDETITYIALKNGFPNVKSFINCCKKTYGCTPTQYKDQFKKISKD